MLEIATMYVVNNFWTHILLTCIVCFHEIIARKLAVSLRCTLHLYILLRTEFCLPARERK